MVVKLMTVKDVADYLSLAESTVYRMISDGSLPAIKVGGALRIKPSALDDYLSANETGVRIARVFDGLRNAMKPGVNYDKL